MEPIPTTFTNVSAENIKQEVFENVFDNEEVSISCNESTNGVSDDEDSDILTGTTPDDIEDKIDKELEMIENDQTSNTVNVLLLSYLFKLNC